MRKNSLPASPDAYKIELPEDFVPAVGAPEFKFNESAPELAALRTLAHAEGWPQGTFSKVAAIAVQMKQAEAMQDQKFYVAQVAELGSNGPQRVDAVLQWMDGSGLSELKGGIHTAKQVQAWEKHISHLTSQGTAPFSQSHRVAPEQDKIPNYENLSFEQRRHAQELQRARRGA